jgi:hypothetical protein
VRKPISIKECRRWILIVSCSYPVAAQRLAARLSEFENATRQVSIELIREELENNEPFKAKIRELFGSKPYGNRVVFDRKSCCFLIRFFAVFLSLSIVSWIVYCIYRGNPEGFSILVVAAGFADAPLAVLASRSPRE